MKEKEKDYREELLAEKDHIIEVLETRQTMLDKEIDDLKEIIYKFIESK